MRTTLTLDDDVAALVRRAVKRRAVPLKQVINDALRAGLMEAAVVPKGEPYFTPPHDGGRVLAGDIRDIGGVLAGLDDGNA